MRTGVNCIKCKGRLMCGLPHCPVYEKLNVKAGINESLSKDFNTDAPGVMIGWNGYPEVHAGLLAPIKTRTKQTPRDWVNNNDTINNIMSYCSSLLNSRNTVQVKQLKGFNEYVQQTALSSKPLNIDVALKKPPTWKITYDIHAQPHGPTGDIEKLKINEDPVIKKPVYKVNEDTDLLATNAITYLKENKMEEYEISTLLSAGTIGIGKNRKLVPTRWAITATDDTLGKQYINQIRNNTVIDNYKIYHGRYLGNVFTILLMPNQWSYELLELWQPGAVYNQGSTQATMTDYEYYNGRKTYATNCGGGYYAARLPITEMLAANKQQATCIVIRQITKDYYMPLGVWVVREAVRKALTNMKEFSNYELAKTYTERITGVDLRTMKLIQNKQTRITQYFNK